MLLKVHTNGLLAITSDLFHVSPLDHCVASLGTLHFPRWLCHYVPWHMPFFLPGSGMLSLRIGVCAPSLYLIGHTNGRSCLVGLSKFSHYSSLGTGCCFLETLVLATLQLC